MISRLISSGWYHHVWCILTPTMWSMVLCILPRSVSVACLQYLPVSCERDGLWARLPWHLQELFWWGCEYWYFLLTNMYRQFVLSWCTFELCYWPARSFSRVPRRHASLLCQWVLLHGWLTLMWRSLKMSSLLGSYDSPRCYRPIPLSCGGTNSCNIFAITPCVGIWSFHQEAWKPCLVVVLDHNNVNWWWRLYDFKGA
jgi:hypothetical protein